MYVNYEENPTGRKIWERYNVQRRTEEGHAWLKVKEEFFYADDRMVAPTNPGWLQTAFDTLTGIFGRVRLRKNVRKTVGMVCHSCGAAGVWENEDYTR